MAASSEPAEWLTRCTAHFVDCGLTVFGVLSARETWKQIWKVAGGAPRLLLVLGLALLIEVVFSRSFSQQMWGGLGLGPQGDAWPPAGTFLSQQLSAKPGSTFLGGALQSKSRLVALNTSGGLFQVELGTAASSLVSGADMNQYLTLAPGKTAITQLGIYSLTHWNNGGLIAGTGGAASGALEVWRDASALQQRRGSDLVLRVSGAVLKLLALHGGGVMAGLWRGQGALLVWPTAQDVLRGLQPTVLLPLFSATALLQLANGGFVVGLVDSLGAPTIAMWPDLPSLMRGAAPTQRLPTPGRVNALLALPNFGLAAATQLANGGGTVEVWQNSSAVQGAQLSSRLTMPGAAVAIVLLDSGGFIVGVQSVTGQGGGLAVWSNISVVLQGGPPVTITRASAAVWELFEVPGTGGVIAAGTSSNVDLWPNSLAVLRGDPPTVGLEGTGQVNAMLALKGGGLAAGTLNRALPKSGPGGLSLWPFLQPLLQRVQKNSLRASNSVYATLSLSGGGLAAGTVDFLYQDRGSVDLWLDSAQLMRLPAPTVSLPASGCVFSLLELPGGGIAAGTGHLTTSLGLVDVWANASMVAAGGGSTVQLNASGVVQGLALLGNETLAAGTQGGLVDLWLNISNASAGDRPALSLPASGRVYAVLALPSGALVAATSAGTVDIWLQPLQSDMRIVIQVARGPEEVHCVTWMPSGTLAAGTHLRNSTLYAGAVYLWPNASTALQGAQPSVRIAVDGQVSSLLALPGGGLAAGITNANGGLVMVWSDQTQLLLGQPPLAQLQASDDVQSISLLSGGGLAAGTSLNSVDLWASGQSLQGLGARDGSGPAAPTPAGAVYAAGLLLSGLATGSISDQGPLVEVWTPGPSGFTLDARLVAGSLPLSILELSTGELIVGTLSGGINLWSPPLSTGALGVRLPVAGAVQALVELPGIGFMAAVHASGAAGSTLQRWRTVDQALQGQPADLNVSVPYQVTALLWVDSSLLIGSANGLLVWTPTTPTRLLFETARVSALTSLPRGGVAIGSDDYQVRVWLTVEALLQGSWDARVQINLTAPGLMASIAVFGDGSLVAGGAAFTPVKCPAGQFSQGGSLNGCKSCSSGWLSQPGAASCGFSDLMHLAVSSAAMAAFFGAGMMAARGLKYLSRRLSAGLLGVVLTQKGFVAVAALSVLLAALLKRPGDADGLLLVCQMSVCALLGWRSIAQTDGRYLALFILFLVAASTFQLIFTPSGQMVITAVGRLQVADSPLRWLRAALLSASVIFASLAYAVPVFEHVERGRARPLPFERHIFLEAWSMRRATVAAFAVPRNILPGSISSQAVAQESTEDTLSESSTRCKEHCLRLLWVAVDLSGSFTAEQGIMLALALYTLVQMGAQLERVSSADVSACLIFMSVLIAFVQCLVSGLAIFETWRCLPAAVQSVAKRLVDRHLRWAVVLKYLALSFKLMVLVLPFQQEEKDVYLWWQCQTPQLCPDSCTQRRSGTCGTGITLSGNPVCLCMVFEDAAMSIVWNCALTAIVSVCITGVSGSYYLGIPEYVETVQGPKVKLVAQTGLVAVPGLIQLLYLWMISEVEASCLSMADVAVVVYPCVVLGLMANEVKRALAGWCKESQQLFSTLYSDDLLLTMRPLAILLSMLGSVAAAARARGISAFWPTSQVNCGSTVIPWVLISLLFALGAVAAALSGPIAAPKPDPELPGFALHSRPAQIELPARPAAA